MSMLSELQIALVAHLREYTTCGDYLPFDDEYSEFIQIKQTNTSDLSNKHCKRRTISFAFHLIYKMGDSARYLELLDVLENLEEIELDMENTVLDNVKLSSISSFVDVKINETFRHAIVHIQFDVSQK